MISIPVFIFTPVFVLSFRSPFCFLHQYRPLFATMEQQFQRRVSRRRSSLVVAATVAAVVLLMLAYSPQSASAVSFELPATTVRCFKESVHKGQQFVGSYSVSDPANQQIINLKVTDSHNGIVYAKDNIDTVSSKKFAFSADQDELYEFCFESRVDAGVHVTPEHKRDISISFKQGVEARDYEALAQAEQLKPLELTMRKVEDLSQSILSSFEYLRQREEEMRDTNESTNERVMYFSILSMVILIALAVWQIFYLKRYFKSKQIIN
ncbi:transmembrane emp24 domain-containing protein 10 [Capsaspora owczarzaki ATCC 30864]|nr:transmembrane emp24 domain-containing protein 10 [Capsaspora owczarzaki ATCC 30864]|eukprot:XP_004364128.2 transmembrane emp24 domain-containing protein 10 [Capsaspora owczarzaki ATCC 30864]